MQIIYNAQMQPHNKIEIEKYLNKYVWLLPKWCHRLTVGLWDANENGHLASMRSNYTYRFCELDIYSGWMDRTDEIKEQAIIHELLHCHLAIMADYSRNTINNLCSQDEAPKFNEHLQTHLTMFHEQITEDLALAVYSKINEQTNPRT